MVEENNNSKREALKEEFDNLKKAINTTPLSRSSLITILAKATSLLFEASALGLNLQISEFLQKAEDKVKDREVRLDQDRADKLKDKAESEAVAAEEQRRLEEALNKLKVESFIAEANRLKEQRNYFDQNSNYIITLQRREEESITKVLQNIKNSGKVDLHELSTIIKTPEEINEEYEKRQSLYKYQEEVTKHHIEVSAHHQQLLEKQKKLQKEIDLEDGKPVKTRSPEIHKKKELLKYHTNNLNDFSPIVKNAEKLKGEIDTTIQELDVQDVKLRVLKDNLKKEFQPHLQGPTKHSVMNFFDLLEKEENAIKEGIVKDAEQRKSFLNAYLPTVQRNKNLQNLQSSEDLHSKITQKQLTIESPNEKQNNIPQNPIADVVKKDAKNFDKYVTKSTNKMIQTFQESSGDSQHSFNTKRSSRSNTGFGTPNR